MNEINLKFSPQELAIINDALVQMPYGRVAPLIHSINQQLKAAEAAAQAPQAALPVAE